MVEAASAAGIRQLELQLPLQFPTGPATATSSSTSAAASTASIATSTAICGGLTIASVVGVVGGGSLVGTRAHPAQARRRRQPAVAQTNDSGVTVGGLSPRKSSISSSVTTTIASSSAPQLQTSGGGSSASGSGSGRVRPLGQWSRRWPAGAGESHRTSDNISGGGAGSVWGSGRRLTARLEEQASPGRMSGWQAAPLPFGLQQRPKTSTTTQSAAAVPAPDFANNDGADAQKERRQSSTSTTTPVRRSADADQGAQVQMLPMQLIDVHLELPQWRTTRPRRQFASASSSGSASTTAGLRPGAVAHAGTGPQVRLGRVQLGGQAGPGAADFVGAGAAAARARRLHPMLDARRRRCEELVRATYLTAPGKRTSMTSSLSSSMLSIMPSGGDFGYIIGGIESDDVYSSGLRSRVHSAYFSATAPVTTPPATPPPPEVANEDLSENRQPRSSPASLSQCSSAGSQRTLRSPSPDQQPPPNTAESGRMRRHGALHGRQNLRRDVHIAYQQ